jgi:hypothetical protein
MAGLLSFVDGHGAIAPGTQGYRLSLDKPPERGAKIRARTATFCRTESTLDCANAYPSFHDKLG